MKLSLGNERATRQGTAGDRVNDSSFPPAVPTERSETERVLDLLTDDLLARRNLLKATDDDEDTGDETA